MSGTLSSLSFPPSGTVDLGAIVPNTAPFVTGRYHLRDYINVKDCAGVNFNGNEETAALKQAIHDIQSMGKVVELPEGETYINAPITSTDFVNPLHIRGKGRATSIVNGCTNNVAIGLTGQQSVLGTLPGGATRLSQTLTVDFSTTGLKKGDVLILRDLAGGLFLGDDSEEPQQGGSSQTIVGLPGEYCTIYTVDSPSQVTVYGSLGFNYTTGTQVSLFQPQTGSFRDFSMRWDLGFVPVTSIVRGIMLNSTRDVDVTNVHFEDAQAPQIYVYKSMMWRVESCKFNFAKNLEDVGLNPYGVVAGIGTQGGLMKGCMGDYGRHMITCMGGGATEFSACHVQVVGCLGKNFSASTFDTHPGARWIVFSSCLSVNARHHGFQLRGRDSGVFNPVVNAHGHGPPPAPTVAAGVAIMDGASRCFVMGGHIRHTDVGIQIRDSNSVRIGGGLHIDEPVTDGILILPQRSPFAGEMLEMDIDDLKISGNPSNAGITYGIHRKGFRVGPGVRIPDATTKISGGAAPWIGPQTTMVVPV